MGLYDRRPGCGPSARRDGVDEVLALLTICSIPAYRPIHGLALLAEKLVTGEHGVTLPVTTGCG